MVTKEFITELGKARDLFEWNLSAGTGQFVERRATPRLRIRGKLKDDPDKVIFEPVGAVCFAQTGTAFGEDYWVEAAVSIELSVQDARDLIAAANDMTWRTVDDHREPDPYKQALRKWLLEATGLQASTIAT